MSQKNGEKKEWSEMNLLESSQLATMKRKQVSGSDYNTVYIINMASICNWRLSVCSWTEINSTTTTTSTANIHSLLDVLVLP